MKEIKAFPNRKWVIKAGIAFLVVMGILTFFSNTIMNYSLPKVTVVYSSGGSMTTAIKGTGTIEAITQAKVTAQGARKIDLVNFGVNEDVKEGDIIATYAPATDEEKAELKTAQDTLDALLKQKKTDDLQAPVYDYSMDERSISDAQETLDKANATLASAQGKDAAVASAQADITAAQNKIDALNEEISTLNLTRDIKVQAVKDAESAQTTSNSALLEAKASLSTAQTALALDPGNPDLQKAVNDAQLVVDQAQAAVDQAPAALAQANKDLAAVDQQIKDKSASLKTATASLSTANDKLAAAQALPSVTDAAESVKMAKRSVDDLKKALSDKKKADGIQQQIAAMSDEDKAKALKDAQKKVDDLTALSEQTTITAPKTGRISSVVTSGTETAKGDILVTIDVVEDGFKVPVSFTTDQVSQMQIGMSARIDGWGGSNEDAVVVSIKPDSTDPRNKKTVIFKLNDPNNNYWFSTGTSITLSLNNRSKDYQCIVPLSAIHEESGETFVYSIKTKSSPLGERYIAVKVPVTILAKDDTNAAIDPSALGQYGSSVITETNDKSFKSGDQVRLAEGL
ncbi:MAG: hypothetical protein WCG21_01905 [Eubacteriales bacterium]